MKLPKKGNRAVSTRRWSSREHLPAPTTPRSPAQVVAELAEREGLTEQYVVTRCPELLLAVGLDPGRLPPDTVARAKRINQLAMRALVSRYNGHEPSHARGEVDISRDEIFGFDIRSVVRWMGLDGWSLEEAYPVLDRFNCDLSDVTIEQYLRDGRRGVGREPAPLSSGQQETLREMSEKFQNHNAIDAVSER